MKVYKNRLSLFILIFTAFFFINAFADPAARVARLSDMKGAVTFSPASVDQWTYAKINRPFTTGDRLWADKDARAELQLGAAAIRVGENTSLSIVNLDNKTAQFQLPQGTLNFRVRKIKPGQIYEVDTPNLSFSITKPGDYRIDVDSSGNTVDISAREGQGNASGKNSSYLVDAPQMCRFTGTDLNPQCSALPAADAFDQWCSEREQRVQSSVSRQYVSDEVVGQEDLDNNGSWQPAANYGHVWVPNNVPDGWAPYHFGHWAWIAPWGWTWIDDQPWGFAPFHYGRWVYFEDKWSWVPGPPDVEPVYAPALVVFIGGIGIDIGWFPLGPGEIFIPPYFVTPKYLTHLNRSNTVVNTVLLNKLLKNPKMNLTYQNKNRPNAVIAVSKEAFTKAQPVHKSAITLSKDLINKATVTHTAKIAPVPQSVLGSDKTAKTMPPADVLKRNMVAKTKPPLPPVPFSAQQSQLAKHPGKPLAPKVLSGLKRPPAVSNVHVVQPRTPAALPSKPIEHPAVAPRPASEVPHPPGISHPVIKPEPFHGKEPVELPAKRPETLAPARVPHPPQEPGFERRPAPRAIPQQPRDQRRTCPPGEYCPGMTTPEPRRPEQFERPFQQPPAAQPRRPEEFQRPFQQPTAPRAMPEPCGGPGHPCPERPGVEKR